MNRQEKMFALVEEKMQTNSTITEICKSHNISKDSFVYWHRKYKRLHSASTSDFIPVKISKPTPLKSGLKIVYPNHVEIHIDHPEDINLVKELLNLA